MVLQAITDQEASYLYGLKFKGTGTQHVTSQFPSNKVPLSFPVMLSCLILLLSDNISLQPINTSMWDNSLMAHFK